MSSVSDGLSTVTYLIRRGDDVHADNLLSQDRLGVDAVESASEFCVLGQGLSDEKWDAFVGRTGVGYLPKHASSAGGLPGFNLRLDQRVSSLHLEMICYTSTDSLDIDMASKPQ